MKKSILQISQIIFIILLILSTFFNNNNIYGANPTVKVSVVNKTISSITVKIESTDAIGSNCTILLNGVPKETIKVNSNSFNYTVGGLSKDTQYTVTASILGSQGSTSGKTALNNEEASSGFDPSLVGDGEGIPALEGIFSNIWSTIVFIVQILSIAAIIITGVRYMFASADKKADLKSGLITIIIGSVLVFGASTIASFVVRAATQAGIR